jgi:hypothetical protein
LFDRNVLVSTDVHGVFYDMSGKSLSTYYKREFPLTFMLNPYGRGQSDVRALT